MRARITRKRCICSIIALLVVTGCATAGRNFQSSNIYEIEIDRTRESQIRHWFGEPINEKTMRNSDFKTRILQYVYAKGNPLSNSAQDRTLYVEIKDDFVYSYWFQSSFKEDATDFDTELVDQIKIGETTISDVNSTLGPPGGKFRLPSNLISDEVANDAPEGTNEIYMYYFGTVKAAKIPKYNAKLLVLYFDESGMLVHLDFTEQT